MKQRTITQIGFIIRGISTINHWGGGQERIQMDGTFIPYDEFTHNKIKTAINDGQFGCESIDSAEVDIFIKYDNGSLEYDRTIELVKHQCNGRRGI